MIWTTTCGTSRPCGTFFDVSAVDFPAYEATSLAAVQRSFEEARKTEQNLIEERMRIQIAALF